MEKEEQKSIYEELTDLIGKIDIEMGRSRDRQLVIDRMTEELYEETRPMMVEKRKEEISAAQEEKKMFDEMNKNALINAKKMILALKVEVEKIYHNKIEEKVKRERHVEATLLRLRQNGVEAERLMELEQSGKKIIEGINTSMQEFEAKHFEFIEKLNAQEELIKKYAAELGFEEIEGVTIEDDMQIKDNKQAFGKGYEEFLTEPEKPEAEKTEAEKPEAEKPEAEKPEAGKPEAEKPEAGKTEAGKPEAEKPEAGKPEAGKPGPAKPGPAKPEAGKPGPAKPGPAKPEQQPNRPLTREEEQGIVNTLKLVAKEMKDFGFSDGQIQLMFYPERGTTLMTEEQHAKLGEIREKYSVNDIIKKLRESGIKPDKYSELVNTLIKGDVRETREPETREPETREPETREPETREPETREPEISEPTNPNLPKPVLPLKDIKITICPYTNTIVLEANDKNGKPITVYQELNYDKKECKDTRKALVEKYELSNTRKLDSNVLAILDKAGCVKEIEEYASAMDITDDREDISTFELNYDLDYMYKSEMLNHSEKRNVEKLAKKAKDIGADVSKKRSGIFARIGSLLSSNKQKRLLEAKRGIEKELYDGKNSMERAEIDRGEAEAVSAWEQARREFVEGIVQKDISEQEWTDISGEEREAMIEEQLYNFNDRYEYKAGGFKKKESRADDDGRELGDE